jgi:hypothetical protein
MDCSHLVLVEKALLPHWLVLGLHYCLLLELALRSHHFFEFVLLHLLHSVLMVDLLLVLSDLVVQVLGDSRQNFH